MSNFYKVTTEKDPLRLRSEASTATDDNIIAKMPKGTVVEEVIGAGLTPSGWKCVKYNGKTGYASSTYLTPCSPEGEKQGEPEKTGPQDEATDGGEKKSGAKALLIVGGVVVVAGVLMNVFM